MTIGKKTVQYVNTDNIVLTPISSFNINLCKKNFNFFLLINKKL